MSRARSRRDRSNTKVSEHVVQSVPFNANLPPGSKDPTEKHVEASEGTNEDLAVQIDDAKESGEQYPESKVVDEEAHKEQVEAEAETRVKRASKVTGPRRLSEREKQLISILLGLTIVKDAESVTDVVIPIESVPEDIKASFFELGSERNIFQRGLATAEYGGEPKAITGLKLTEIGLHLYSRVTTKGEKTVSQKSTTKANGEPKGPGGRKSTKYHDGLKLRKIAEDPRPAGTMGAFSWQLYKDGMTYSEYMAIKDYGDHYSLRTGEKFRGPGLNHWSWDLEHGFTGLYHEGQEEKLEDGSDNPKYWAVNNNPR